MTALPSKVLVYTINLTMPKIADVPELGRWSRIPEVVVVPELGWWSWSIMLKLGVR